MGMLQRRLCRRSCRHKFSSSPVRHTHASQKQRRLYFTFSRSTTDEPVHVSAFAKGAHHAAGLSVSCFSTIVMSGRQEATFHSPDAALKAEIGGIRHTLAPDSQTKAPQTVDHNDLTFAQRKPHLAHQFVDDALHLAGSECRVLTDAPRQFLRVYFAGVNRLRIPFTKATLRSILALTQFDENCHDNLVFLSSPVQRFSVERGLQDPY